MAIIIAEYLGQRTDTAINIQPYLQNSSTVIPLCPFNNLPCAKLKKKTNPTVPVCSLRRNGELYIVCEHRLASSTIEQSKIISPYQSEILYTLAKEVFSPSITPAQIAFRAEVTMATGSRADFILAITPETIASYGPKRLIVEMQGGGETSNTGGMTRKVQTWAVSSNPTNAALTEIIGTIGLITTNAWRRLQEQFLAKASVAAASGYGFVACVGAHLFDYVREKLGNDFNQFSLPKDQLEWNVALIAWKEASQGISVGTSIPLEIDTNRTVYTTYARLSQALTNQGSSDLAAFNGTYQTLDSREIILT
jgi:hypothetical protein